jgi:hypothetical protein
MEIHRPQKIPIFCFLLLICFLLQDTPANGNLHKLTNGQLVEDGLRVKVIAKVQTQIYRRPHLNSRTVREVKLFQILNVFSATDDSAQLKNGRFYRVGIADKPQPLGWVYEKHVVKWNHRQCLKLTPQQGRQLAHVYADEDFSEVISKEPKGGTSENKYFPLLEKPKREAVNGALQTLYRVAYLHRGGAVGYARERSQIDIVFVMDTTLSMGPFINGAKNVVKEIATEVARRGESGMVRLGLVAYRDRVEKETEMEYHVKRICPLTPDLEHFKEKLHQTGKAKISSEEYSECIYDGLYKAIVNSNWRTGIRIIVLIGDNSAHEPGTPENPSPKNPNNYSVGQLWTLMKNKSIRLMAIQIKGAPEKDYIIHRKQLEALTKKRGPMTGGTIHTVKPGQENEQQFEFEDELGEALKVGLNFRRRIQNIAEEMYGGETVLPPQTDGLEDNWVYMLDPVHQKEGAAFSAGWLPASIDGKQLVETRVMMTRNEMSLLLIFLYGATTGLEASNQDVIDITIKTLEKQTGEKLQGDLGDAIKRHGLPVKKSGLLQFDLRDVLNWTETKRREQLELVDKKRNLLSDFFNKKPQEWENGIAFVPIEYLP